MKIIIITKKFNEILNDFNKELLKPHSIFEKICLHLFVFILFLVIVSKIKIINKVLAKYFESLIIIIFLIGN